MIAVLIRSLGGFANDARLYRMEPPLEGHEYVVVSAADVMFTGPETYIFPASKDGRVIDWGEMDGSYRGGLSHEEALRGAGYEIGSEADADNARDNAAEAAHERAMSDYYGGDGPLPLAEQQAQGKRDKEGRRW